MLSRLTVVVALVVGLVAAGAGSARRSDYPGIQWHTSRSLGMPWDGRLVGGVRLPAQGATFFTWDPALKRSPNRAWRRWGNSRLVRTLLDVLDAFAAAHPGAARVGVGDLSRPRGGNFGPQFGGLGHASHQNGLDADVYYPRKDRRERAPTRPAQIDRRLAQELVDRFVAVGARYVFVGPHTGLRGPRAIVEPLVHHDNHLHVRIPNPLPARRSVLGRSSEGRLIRAVRVGDPASERCVLVVGCIHGDECAGTEIAKRLIGDRLVASDLWVVPNLNPDGLARGTRQNGRGVDLNRNFPSEWQPIGSRGDPEYSGPEPLSEPETRLVSSLIRRIRPDITIWYHQPQAIVRAWGRSMKVAKRYARLAGMPFRAIRWPNGTAPNWQNHAMRRGASFVVELPAGGLAPPVAARHAEAVLALATGR